jgi:hypothetical protein
MLLMHVSFSLGLIALVAGVSLYLWSVRAEAGPGIRFAKTIGIIVIILAILELVCTVYSAVRFKNLQREWRSMMPATPAAPTAPQKPSEQSSGANNLSEELQLLKNYRSDEEANTLKNADPNLATPGA